MLSRILRNNDFIRIFAICQICLLIFTIPVFAQPNTQDISGMVNRVNNFTVWSDFTTNVNAYYGDNTASYLDTVNTATYNELVKLYNAFRSQFYTSGIYAWTYNITNHTMNGANNSPAAKVLEAIGYNTAYLSSMAYSTNSSVSSIYTQVYNHLAKSTDFASVATPLSYINITLGGTTSGNIYDIKNALLDLEKINWNVLSTSSAFYSDLGVTQLTNYNTRTNAANPIYVKVDPVSVDDASLFRIKIGIIPQSQFNYNRLINNITFYNASGSVLPMPETYIEFVPSQGFLYLYIYNYTFQNSGITYIKFDMSYDYRYLNNLFSFQYIPSTDIDYYLVQYKGLLKELIDKDFTAEIDGSDLNIEINDSINVTPINLDVQIGIDDFTQVNTISNKLRSWLSTGVGVVDLIAALDELDDTFFTLHNRSVIETISTGYTDYYD